MTQHVACKLPTPWIACAIVVCACAEGSPRKDSDMQGSLMGAGVGGAAATAAGAAAGQGVAGIAAAGTSGAAGTNATAGSSGTTAGTGGSSGTAGASVAAGNGSSGEDPVAGAAGAAGIAPGPVDCSAIASSWELCDSGPGFCAAVFDDGAGCDAVCAAAGLTCKEVWEDVDGECAPDMDRAALGCASPSGHDSDYCVCEGDGTSSAGSGGASGAAGAAGNAGASGAAGEAGTAGTGGPTVMDLCDPPAGSTTVNATIVVGAGQTFDGECGRFIAGPAVGDGSQDEGQDPVFRLEEGATLLNVVIGAPAADGIHTYGDATLRNITWEDVGEDALTIKESGTVVLDGGAAFNGEDKIFQINAASTFRVSSFRADNAGKFIRQNGGTTFQVDVYIDACDISNMDESIFRTDSSSSSVTMTNTRYSNIGEDGDELWLGLSANNITESGNTQY